MTLPSYNSLMTSLYSRRRPIILPILARFPLLESKDREDFTFPTSSLHSIIFFFKRSNSMEMENKSTRFSNLLVPFLVVLSSFLLSHPLYFLKLLSFLSPLLITTFFILLFTSYRALLERLRGNVAGERGSEKITDENEVYKIFFEATRLDGGSGVSEELVDKFLISGDYGSSRSECLQEKKSGEETDYESSSSSNAQAEKTLEELFQEKEEGEPEAVEEKEVKEVEEAEAESKNCDLVSKPEGCGSRSWRNSRRLRNSLKIFEKSSGGLGGETLLASIHGGFGSMRRNEKEWKRTLACKLFEERHSNGDSDAANGEGVGGGDDEGMDSLWETYEKKDSSMPVSKSGQIKKAAKRKEEDEDEDEDEEEMSRQFCCLQALKLSAGKVNLGMGKPNMANISKAFRGIRWLHHARSRKGLH